MCFEARAAHLHFKSYLDRIRTFTNWPRRVQTPEALASVGFFRNKEGKDEVQCFSCGIRIYDWQPDDDPLDEHLRWSKNCKFANIIKNELLEKAIKLYVDLKFGGGVDVAGNNSDRATNKKNCPLCTYVESVTN